MAKEVYPKEHMHYAEPNIELLVTYKLSGLCLRCGEGKQSKVRGKKSNFCMPCWMYWWDKVAQLPRNVKYKELYVDEYT